MDYRDMVDRMDDFADEYYHTKTDNKYLNRENSILKQDNDTLVDGIRSLNKSTRRRYRYSGMDTQCNQDDKCNKNEDKATTKGCCFFNFNFTNIVIIVGVLFLFLLASGVTPETSVTWASTKDMWIEFICDPYKIILVLALILIYKNKKVQ